MTARGAEGVHDRLDAALGPISDPELRRGVVTLFEMARGKAEAGEIDLIVLAARRLACVYQLLTAHGMKPLPPTCTVVSDRFLDIDLYHGPAPWKSVLILDDSVILGTTLVRIHSDIREKASQSVQISSWAVCVDSAQRAQYMLDLVDFRSLFERNPEAVQQFSEQIVQALFAGGIPFFSDFPTTVPMKYSWAEWHKHLENADWRVADVTAPIFDGRQREALAQIPTDETVDRFLSRLPRVIASLVEGFKVRSYATSQGDDVEVRFVPIAMLAPCSPSDLDKALEALLLEFGSIITDAEPALPWQEWKPVAKHRLVQMYASSCVLEMMLGTSYGPVDQVHAGMLDLLQIELYFGKASRRVQDLFDAAVQAFRQTSHTDAPRPPRDLLSQPTQSWVLQDDAVRQVLWANAELIAYTGVPKEPVPGELSKVGLVFAHAISSVFGFITAELEIPQRRQIKSLGGMRQYESLFVAVPERRVLAQGFTMRDLAEALIPESMDGPSWSRALVSLGIDIGNDLGIVVPVTQFDERRNLVYRCYRLGETAPLAGKPLPQAALSCDWDDLARTASAGTPIANTVVPLTERRSHFDTDASLDELHRVVTRAVPGTVVFRLEGVVIGMSDVEFTAEFHDDTMEPPMRIATFPRWQLGTSRSDLKRGSLVMWTVLDRQEDIPERTSRVTLRREPRLDVAQMTRDAEALADLLKVDDAAVSTG
jgi:hypothetical protein